MKTPRRDPERFFFAHRKEAMVMRSRWFRVAVTIDDRFVLAITLSLMLFITIVLLLLRRWQHRRRLTTDG